VTLTDALDQGFLYKLQHSLPAGSEIQAMDEADYFDFIKSGCADEESFQQEYLCNPADDNSAFLDYDLIAGCEYATEDSWHYSLEQLQAAKGELYGGLDIGRTSDLTVLWIVEKLGDSLYTRVVLELKNLRKSEQEKAFYPFMPLLKRICFDYTGLGIGWGDDAQDRFGSYRVETVTFTNAVKETMAYQVRGAFEDKKLRIPFAPEIRADLRAITKTTTAAGNIRFAAERTQNGHSDRFWALALAIHAAGTPAIPIEFAATGRRSMAQDSQAIITDQGFGAVAGSTNTSGF
jgi:phage FluMu gp28-like protein